MFRILLFVFFLNLVILSGQDFNKTLNHRGSSVHGSIDMLPDSSFVSFTPVSYYNVSKSEYDTFKTLLVRFNRSGDIMYYKSISSPENFFFSFLDLVIKKNKIFLAGHLDYKDSVFAFLMKLDECLNIEKFTVFNYKRITSQNELFYSLENYSDSELIVTGPLIQSDSVFNSILMLDHNFKVKWTTSVHGHTADIAINNNKVYLWGKGYYPLNDGSGLSELKANSFVLDQAGKIIFQNIENEHVPGFKSAGWKIISSGTNKFLIGNYGSVGSKFNNEVIKIKPDGTEVKKVKLNNLKDNEFPASLARINDNRFIAVGLIDIDRDTMICNAYLIDSNLNVIRKKRLLPNTTLVSLYSAFPVEIRSEVLLYGLTHTTGSGKDPKGTLLKIDTFLNVAQVPNISNYTDSLCLLPKTKELYIPVADTVFLEDLELRKNLYLNLKNIADVPNHFKLYPNPTKGMVNLEFKTPESGHVVIRDALGRLISIKDFNQSKDIQIDLSNNVSGFIFITIQGGNFSSCQKVLVLDTP